MFKVLKSIEVFYFWDVITMQIYGNQSRMKMNIKQAINLCVNIADLFWKRAGSDIIAASLVDIFIRHGPFNTVTIWFEFVNSGETSPRFRPFQQQMLASSTLFLFIIIFISHTLCLVSTLPEWRWRPVETHTVQLIYIFKMAPNRSVRWSKFSYLCVINDVIFPKMRNFWKLTVLCPRWYPSGFPNQHYFGSHI